MKNRKVSVLICFLTGLLLCVGCGGMAENKMVKYIENKYGETPVFEYVKKYDNNSKGYYGKTTDGYYVRYTDFGVGETDVLCDTKQYDEISQVVLERLKAYATELSITDEIGFTFYIGSETEENSLWRSLWNGYDADAIYDGGDVTEFLQNAYPYMYSAYVGDNYNQTGVIMIYSDEMYEQAVLGEFILKAVEEFGISMRLCVISPGAKEIFDNSGDYWITDNSCMVLQACDLHAIGSSSFEEIDWESEQEICYLNDAFSIAPCRINPNVLNQENWSAEILAKEEMKLPINYWDSEYEVVQDGILLKCKEPEAKYISFSMDVSEALANHPTDSLFIFVTEKNGDVEDMISLSANNGYDKYADVGSEVAYSDIRCAASGTGETIYHIWVAVQKKQ